MSNTHHAAAFSESSAAVLCQQCTLAAEHGLPVYHRPPECLPSVRDTLPPESEPDTERQLEMAVGWSAQ